MLCRKSCYEIYRSAGLIFFLKLQGCFSLQVFLKLIFYYFIKHFPGQTKATNENTESISRPLYKF